MDLKGARYVMEETPEARRLNVARLKKTIGTPEFPARRLYKDPVVFRPPTRSFCPPTTDHWSKGPTTGHGAGWS
jgi:hypothetical protein